MRRVSGKLKGLLAAFVLAASFASAAQAELDQNVVNLSATADQLVARDLMEVDFVVSAHDPDRQKAAAEVTEKANKLAQAIREVKEVQLQTSTREGFWQALPGVSFSISGKQAWYDTARFTVSSKDFDALSKLTADVSQIAAVESIQCRVSRSRLAEIEDQLVKSALDRFKAKADMIAKHLGFSSYSIGTISVVDMNGETPVTNCRNFSNMKSAELAAPETVEPGTARVQLSVTGSIQMK